MNVGIVSVDSLIPNLALMKLSAWHKSQGDSCEIAFPLATDSYDLIYRSKVFDFSPDDPTDWPCDTIEGGTGYSLDSHLPCPENVYPVYVLVGFDTTPEEDEYRVRTLADLRIQQFVMPYDKEDPYQRAFARLVNRPQIFRTMYPRKV